MSYLYTEQSAAGALNINVFGQPCVWISVPCEEQPAMEALIKHFAPKEGEQSLQYRKRLLCHPLLLDHYGIEYHISVQRPGDVIYTKEGSYHSGFNWAFNIKFAVNIVSLNKPALLRLHILNLQAAIAFSVRGRCCTGDECDLFVEGVLDHTNCDDCKTYLRRTGYQSELFLDTKRIIEELIPDHNNDSDLVVIKENPLYLNTYCGWTSSENKGQGYFDYADCSLAQDGLLLYQYVFTIQSIYEIVTHTLRSRPHWINLFAGRDITNLKTICHRARGLGEINIFFNNDSYMHGTNVPLKGDGCHVAGPERVLKLTNTCLQKFQHCKLIQITYQHNKPPQSFINYWIKECEDKCPDGITTVKIDGTNTFISPFSWVSVKSKYSQCKDMLDRLILKGIPTQGAGMKTMLINHPSHHATSLSDIEGFCLANPVAAILKQKTDDNTWPFKTAWVDLDIHEGDGTAAILKGTKNTSIYDVYAIGAYPSQQQSVGIQTENASHIRIGLSHEAGEVELITAFLQTIVPRLISTKPTCIIVACGTDGCAGDPMSKAQYTKLVLPFLIFPYCYIILYSVIPCSNHPFN